MGQHTYPKHHCFFCGKVISAAGFAKAAHYRSHVRKGEAVEIGPSHPEYGGQYEWVTPEYEAARVAKLNEVIDG